MAQYAIVVLSVGRRLTLLQRETERHSRCSCEIRHGTLLLEQCYQRNFDVCGCLYDFFDVFVRRRVGGRTRCAI